MLSFSDYRFSPRARKTMELSNFTKVSTRNAVSKVPSFLVDRSSE